MYKADVDSAFRRLPLKKEHRKSAIVAFRQKGEAKLYMHNAMCFGAVASVYEWDRIGMCADSRSNVTCIIHSCTQDASC